MNSLHVGILQCQHAHLLTQEAALRTWKTTATVYGGKDTDYLGISSMV
ncbi:hypothetical protein MM59RIKEN_21780 [Pusillibacter faecalis]|uniref:Uncharacterized protein n=1 Tax=Pusillibacter faecalis TaxID=2714358 RepID=A0A810Q9D4_9FIRM|nr:hypothetical protein MM59RIKEN_21780 [Pusillibacter faecalis]